MLMHRSGQNTNETKLCPIERPSSVPPRVTVDSNEKPHVNRFSGTTAVYPSTCISLLDFSLTKSNVLYCDIVERLKFSFIYRVFTFLKMELLVTLREALQLAAYTSPSSAPSNSPPLNNRIFSNWKCRELSVNLQDFILCNVQQPTTKFRWKIRKVR